MNTVETPAPQLGGACVEGTRLARPGAGDTVEEAWDADLGVEIDLTTPAENSAEFAVEWQIA
jgi:hypothetical protein